jgi:hypothetical protein
MRPSPTNPGRTYKFYTGQPAYEFGSGLSYTTFAYSWSNDITFSSYDIRILMKNKQHALLRNFRVNVTNTGSMPGDDVVLGFISAQNQTINHVTPPIKQLFGFKKVHLNVNETTQVFFSIKYRCSSYGCT